MTLALPPLVTNFSSFASQSERPARSSAASSPAIRTPSSTGSSSPGILTPSSTPGAESSARPQSRHQANLGEFRARNLDGASPTHEQGVQSFKATVQQHLAVEASRIYPDMPEGCPNSIDAIIPAIAALPAGAQKASFCTNLIANLLAPDGPKSQLAQFPKTWQGQIAKAMVSSLINTIIIAARLGGGQMPPAGSLHQL